MLYINIQYAIIYVLYDYTFTVPVQTNIYLTVIIHKCRESMHVLVCGLNGQVHPHPQFWRSFNVKKRVEEGHR